MLHCLQKREIHPLSVGWVLIIIVTGIIAHALGKIRYYSEENAEPNEASALKRNSKSKSKSKSKLESDRQSNDDK